MAEIQGEEADQKFMKRGEEQKDEDITDRIEIEGEEGEVDKEHGEDEGEEWEEEEDDEVTKRVKARMMMKDYNPLETMMSAFQQSSSSAQIELKQRLPDGSYQPAPNGTMEAIGSQAKIAATASVIANMTKEEKTKWAIDKRNEGNQSYLRKEFEGAIQIYLECLTATEFTQKDSTEQSSQSSGNIQEVVIPVLCNLAACCVQLKDWGKVIKFCDQCLLLSSSCQKALVRRGMAYFYLGEYQLSLDDFHAALRCSSQSSNKDGFQTSEEENSVSENENKKKIQSFILKAEKGLSEQNKAILKRKSALQKAFHSNSVLESNSKSQRNPPAVATATEGRRLQWNRKEILLFISMICILAIAIFVGTLTLE